MAEDPDARYRYVRLVGTFGTIPLMLGVGPLVGYFAGHWLDRRCGTAPWLTVVFLILGFVAAIRYVVRLLRTAQKDLDRL